MDSTICGNKTGKYKVRQRKSLLSKEKETRRELSRIHLEEIHHLKKELATKEASEIKLTMDKDFAKSKIIILKKELDWKDSRLATKDQMVKLLISVLEGKNKCNKLKEDKSEVVKAQCNVKDEEMKHLAEKNEEMRKIISELTQKVSDKDAQIKDLTSLLNNRQNHELKLRTKDK